MQRRTVSLWVVVLYLAQGLPFGVATEALPVFLRRAGMSLADVGYLNLLHLPWSLKVLWAPWVDRVATPRRWMAGALGLNAAALAGMAVLAAQGRGLSAAFMGLLLVLTTCSATQDIAIDASFVRMVPKESQGPANGLRIAAFRGALVVGGGLSVLLAARLPWSAVFALLALSAAALALVLTRLPPAAGGGGDGDGGAQPQSLRAWLRSLGAWLWRPGSIGLCLFLLLYRLGDASMAPMVKPFWLDRGMSEAQIGVANTTLGIALTVVGALAGGRYVARFGIFNALWVLGLLQATSNLGYAAVAHFDGGPEALIAASCAESFSQGLGTAAQLALATYVCDRDHAATQFAVLTALFGLSRVLAGSVSGKAAQLLGYAPFFALTFALALPAYALLPWVRRRLQLAD